MPFALHQRPKGIVFLDDDRDYVEMLGEIMPPHWFVRLLLQPVRCIELLQKEIIAREADVWTQQEIINHWHSGASLIPQILQYWQRSGDTRFALAEVCVVDYAMPAMSGLQVLGELAQWHGSRILLTGRADEQLAVSAFNRGLINQFISKQSPDIRTRLTGAIEALCGRPDARMEQIWRTTLSHQQHEWVCDPPVAHALQALVHAQGWVEYVVIGAPFGMLGLTADGTASWLQLEPADKLSELAELAQSQGCDAQSVQDICSGTRLVDLELQLALGNRHSPILSSAVVLPATHGRLHAAVFSLGEAFSPGQVSSYSQFLALHGGRQLQEGQETSP